jgi:hypothetical protein
MSRKSVVSGFRGYAFKGVDFAKWVTRWEDTRDRDGALHKYNKRDGGEGEDMGRKSHVAVVHLAFVGPTWQKDFLRIQAAIDDDPIGTLTHPVYGAMTVYCRASAGVMDVENAPNYYEVTLRFEESQVDTNVSQDSSNASQQGPAAQQLKVGSAAINLSQYATVFTTAASAINALIASATTYAAAAVASASALTADPTLTQQLATTETNTDAAIAAVALDPLAAPGVSDPAVAACELLYDACTQLDDSVRALRPQLGPFTVPMTMHITALAQFFYGADGPTRESEILANNAGRIADPGFISAGTVLLMAPKTTTV